MDKYERTAEYLYEHPDAIPIAWYNPEECKGRGGELFMFVSANGSPSNENGRCGCLTEIRSEPDRYPGVPIELRNEIAADTRIPYGPYDITRRDLHVFVEWQRRLDKDLRS